MTKHEIYIVNKVIYRAKAL